MQRLLTFLMLVAVVGGGYYYLKDYNLPARRGDRTGSGDAGRVVTTSAGGPPAERKAGTIRVASFNIQVFGPTKAGKPHVMDLLADITRRFDVLAVQEIRSRSQDIVPRLIDRINADGRRYDFVLGERQGRTSSKEQFAYLYDRETLELDFDGTYTVDDPDQLLPRPPLVAAFRARGAPAAEAFTFTLINVHTDPDEVETELDLLDDVYRAVRSDGRDEDDVILLGDLNADEEHLGEMGQVSGIAWLLAGVPTNTRGTHLYDNFLLHARSTVEYTGRSGVLDIMRAYNLTLDEALDVSDHLPIWAEFSVYEGGSGRIATRPSGASSTR